MNGRNGSFRGGFFADNPNGPVVKWTTTADHPVNSAIFDVIEALLSIEFDYRDGNFSSSEAYEKTKARARHEFNDRLMMLAGGK